MSNPGRNDPCPCGSGKKFKKCHGEQATDPAFEQWKRTIQMDQRLMEQVGKLGIARYGDQGFDPFFLEPEDAHEHTHEPGEECHHEPLFADISFPLALFSDPRFGAPLAQLFLDAKGVYLAADEREWLQAQLASSFSLWHLVGLGADGEVTLEDRLQDRQLTLYDKDLFTDGRKGDLMLARVVVFAGRAVLTGLHPEVIDEEDAEEAVQAIKDTLASTPDAPGYAAQLALVDGWHTVVYGDDDDESETAHAGE